jgi:signal transduction histidine kinase
VQNAEELIERLMIMQRVETELNERLDVDYVLDIALDAALRASRAHAASIAIIEDGLFSSSKYIGAYKNGVPKAPSGIIARVLHTRQAELISDVSNDPDYIEYIASTRAQMTIPLVSRERIVGVLDLQTNKPDHFTYDVFEFVRLMTGRIAVALDNAQLYHTSQQQLNELQSLYTRVSELERMKTDMIRIAAHDLRAPLSVINGFNGLLLETTLSDKQREYLTYVEKASRQMQRLINDILSLERIEVMQAREHEQVVLLHELVEISYVQFVEPARQKRLDYRLHIDDKTISAWGDPAQIKEAIDNLIGNAVKYTPSQGRVEVSLKRDGDNLRVEVVDNGFGIPPELQNRLFQPFYRALIKETKDIDGTGLGLHLVKNIVERHNGQVTFTSTYGKGSTFGFSLPLVPASVAASTAV